MKDLLKGLKLLNQSDPCVEILVQENGEHILCTAGEVHLQRCIEDLVKRFALVEVNTSPPIIPFKETIIREPEFDLVKERITTTTTTTESSNSTVNTSVNNESTTEGSTTSPGKDSKSGTIVNSDGSVVIHSADKRLTLKIRAKPLPRMITRFLVDNIQFLKLLSTINSNHVNFTDTINILNDFKIKLKEQFDLAIEDEKEQYPNEVSKIEKEWSNIIDRILSFGPNRYGPNMLINCLDKSDLFSTTVWSELESNNNDINKKNSFKDLENGVNLGFQLATSKGPICEEPLEGVAFFIENFEYNNNTSELTNIINDKLNELKVESSDEETTIITKQRHVQTRSSQCLLLMKDACKRAFEAQPQRLMVALYKCEIMIVNCEALGKLYAVLGKRNGRIIDEQMKEGTSMFIVTSYLPVTDSFGLAEEIRKKTSGLASPHIEFSHFETLDIDPYWVPRTEEEKLLFGDKADFDNQAKKYMNEIRKRKGMFVQEKLVEHGEKQRTLGK
jgi:ribosome assembly protein 1